MSDWRVFVQLCRFNTDMVRVLPYDGFHLISRVYWTMALELAMRDHFRQT